MAAAMQGDHCVYGLRPVNLNVAGLNMSVEQLAASHLQQIRCVQEHGPYRLVGYSFGGVVAFEMATLLVNCGEDVGLLALVDTLHPSFRHDLSPVELKRFQKTYRSDRIKKYTRNLIQGKIDLIGSDASRFVAKKVKPIASKMVHTLCIALGLPPPHVDKSVIFSVMLDSYVPKEFRGRLVLFRVENAMDGGVEFDSDPSLGWNKYAKGGVDVELVPGRHGTMMQTPNVLSLVNKLEPLLC
jgi:thioesterase domain-containing protein